MRFPLSLTTTMAGYMAKKKMTGQKRFPLVLMLEPLHACNLTCTGCGRIREYETTIKEKLSVEECLASVDECRRPDRQHLRRRADDLSGNRRAGARHPQAPQAHLPVHQRHVHRTQAARVQADLALLLQRPPRRPGRDARPGRGARRRVQGGRRGHQGGQGGGFPGLHQHDGLQGNRHGRDRRPLRLPDEARRGRLHAVAGLRLHGRA